MNADRYNISSKFFKSILLFYSNMTIQVVISKAKSDSPPSYKTFGNENQPQERRRKLNWGFTYCCPWFFFCFNYKSCSEIFGGESKETVSDEIEVALIKYVKVFEEMILLNLFLICIFNYKFFEC